MSYHRIQVKYQFFCHPYEKNGTFLTECCGVTLQTFLQKKIEKICSDPWFITFYLFCTPYLSTHATPKLGEIRMGTDSILISAYFWTSYQKFMLLSPNYQKHEALKPTIPGYPNKSTKTNQKLHLVFFSWNLPNACITMKNQQNQISLQIYNSSALLLNLLT